MSYFNINYEFNKELVLRRIDEAVSSGKAAGYICVVDGNILTMVHNDTEYREAIKSSMLSICDSSWVPLYLKHLYGMKVEQYCGSDIFMDIIGMKKYRMCFLGANRVVLEALKEKLAAIDPRITDMPFEELPFCAAEEFDYEGIAGRLNAYSPDIVWVALGAPKQEEFANMLAPELKGGCVIIPVGAVFNYFSGVSVKRAPQWMVRSHLEFVYRIFTEPKKQFGRCKAILWTLPAILKEEKRQKQ